MLMASCMVPDMCLYVRLCQTAVICISLIYIKTLFPKKIGTVCIILLNTETKEVQSNFGTEKLYSFFFLILIVNLILAINKLKSWDTTINSWKRCMISLKKLKENGDMVQNWKNFIRKRFYHLQYLMLFKDLKHPENTRESIETRNSPQNSVHKGQNCDWMDVIFSPSGDNGLHNTALIAGVIM